MTIAALFRVLHDGKSGRTKAIVDKVRVKDEEDHLTGPSASAKTTRRAGWGWLQGGGCVGDDGGNKESDAI